MNLTIIKEIVLLRKKSLLLLAVAIGISVALQLFINYYHEPKLEKQRLEWMKQRELAGRGAALQNRESLYKNGVADLAKFRGRIYLKNQFTRFISELYEVAGSNRLELKNIAYKFTLNKEESLLEYQFTLTVSGKYLQLKKFINDLGSTANILVIDSISLASTSSSADTVQLQLQLTSYFRMEGQ